MFNQCDMLKKMLSSPMAANIIYKKAINSLIEDYVKSESAQRIKNSNIQNIENQVRNDFIEYATKYFLSVLENENIKNYIGSIPKMKESEIRKMVENIVDVNIVKLIIKKLKR